MQFNQVTSLTRTFPKKLDFLIVYSLILGFMNILRNIFIVSSFQQRVFGVQGTSRSNVCLVQKSSSKISKEAEPRRRSVIFITLPLFQDELLKCPISFQDALQLSFKRVSFKHSCDDILVIQKTHTYVLILTPVTSSERFMFLVFSMLTFCLWISAWLIFFFYEGK